MKHKGRAIRNLLGEMEAKVSRSIEWHHLCRRVTWVEDRPTGLLERVMRLEEAVREVRETLAP